MFTALILAARMEAIPILGIIFLFVYGVIHIDNRKKERQQRLRILEEAVRTGQLDEQMRAEIVAGLSGRARKQEAMQAHAAHVAAHKDQSGWGKLFFTIGWLGLFAGIGMLIAHENEDMLVAGCVMTGASFALVTLPLAWRELEAKRQPTS